MKMTDKDLPETWWIDMKEKLDKLEKVMEIIKENLM
ncbi:MAG: hypothetical protein PWP27_2087 [Clostridiales bacterium]|jgi:hypothetical protein|nr:hypothetical protein [Clostridiales bacterium]MDK2934277.1 hypothetical protein [Clostridiales bacterium]